MAMRAVIETETDGTMTTTTAIFSPTGEYQVEVTMREAGLQS